MLDDEISGDEDDSRKRSRSKFATERAEGEEITTPKTQENDNKITHNNAPPVVKRPRRDYDDIHTSSSLPSVSEDDFAALLQKHEKHKHTPTTQEPPSKHDNRNNYNNNRNSNAKNNQNNRNYKNNNQNKQNNNNNNNNNRRQYNNNNNNRNNYNKNNNHDNNNNKPVTMSRFEQELSSLLSSSSPPLSPLSDEIKAGKIASFLHETNAGLITVIISVIGIEETIKFIKETIKIEEGGGMKMASDAKRRRTPGGCFFYLVKEGVKEEEKIKIFTDERGKRDKVLWNKNNKNKKKQVKRQNNKNDNKQINNTESNENMEENNSENKENNENDEHMEDNNNENKQNNENKENNETNGTNESNKNNEDNKNNEENKENQNSGNEGINNTAESEVVMDR